ncbi:helix-turn-helix transcriptional regulator [Flavobacterium gawalongense]|uniref:Helix-turn-helix transcriptional regulator n=1 Tax=Flavobacterium gawalongense TaxID=2594432 RepID=A0A553BJZ6_9FLAO|nr:helix-turn-helix transcriptional regulator [Flavobacterium gawalongense]TRX08572.1 helix-turn-helix transcriptional regulator [Flavobacterium gawalongense]TRX09555.1 helix-turn-helix transcriptional regulator [Flavobacterium gawalongense]TRX25564.1 helix-turn-helix transcriptional regulator [Flavobacterium gawalongense]
MKQEKLINMRKTRGYSQVYMAQQAAMEQTTYSKKEIGKSNITDAEWNKFAKVLNVPLEEIKDLDRSLAMKNKNWDFNNNEAGIQYINMPENVFDIIMKYNGRLEEENEHLRQEILSLKQGTNTIFVSNLVE